MSAPQNQSKKIVVAGVPEHFNLPWHQAIESNAFLDAGINLEYVDVPGGTGAMMRGLNEEKFDLAIVLFEGSVKNILKGSSNKIVKVYIESPLIWGIHVAYESEIQNTDDMKGKRYAISRFGSGSHLMAIVDASERGWPTEKLDFEKIGNLNGARKALLNGDADIFLWERFTTEPYVQSGEFRCIGERRTLWPAFVVCVREEVLNERCDEVKTILDIVNQSCGNLMAAPNACKLISDRYGLELNRVRDWFNQTEWNTDFSRPDDAIESIKQYLQKLDLVTKAESNATDVWFDLCDPIAGKATDAARGTDVKPSKNEIETNNLGTNQMIRHTVMFTLKHAKGSKAEQNFLKQALALAEIPTVKNFEQLRQVSKKCEHHFGFSMEFDSQSDYETYNDHPAHTKFVNEHWIPEVKSFQEIDYEPYNAS
ncbi:MAG: Dabb family protein [Mariniblastus sp.]